MTKELLDEQLTTVQIYYYMPDYQNLLQEFMWQTVDYNPDFPRIMRFLQHWQDNINAQIEAIYLMHSDYWGRISRINFTHRFEQ